MSRVSLLIVGEVAGRFAELDRAIVAAQAKHGPFQFVLCCGDFFGHLAPAPPASPTASNSTTATLSPAQSIGAASPSFSTTPVAPAAIAAVSSSAPDPVQNFRAPNPPIFTSTPTPAQQQHLPSPAASPQNADYLSGVCQFALPVLFVDSSDSPLGSHLRVNCPLGAKLTDSLEFLGSFGIKSLLQGVRVAYLSGSYSSHHFLEHVDDEVSVGGEDVEGSGGDVLQQETTSQTTVAAASPAGSGCYEGSSQSARCFAGSNNRHYCVSAIRRMKEQLVESSSPGTIDVMLCNEWPTDLDSTLTQPVKDQLRTLYKRRLQPSLAEESSPAVAELIELGEPRYVVCTGRNLFFQRPVFSTTTKGLACRLLALGSLATFNKADKSTRFVHGLCIHPIARTANPAIYRCTPATANPSPFFALFSHLHPMPAAAAAAAAAVETPPKTVSSAITTAKRIFSSSDPPSLDKRSRYYSEERIGGSSTASAAGNALDVVRNVLETSSSKRGVGRAALPYPCAASFSGGQSIRPHSECWFCLSNPKCERRLIVALGNKSYVALAKGGLVPRHVIVVPISHYPNVTYCPPDVLEELMSYVAVLRRCFAAFNQGTIVFERHVPMRSSTGMHTQLQVIPIPASAAAANVFLRKVEERIPAQSQQKHQQVTGGLAGLVGAVGCRTSLPYFYFEAPAAAPGASSSQGGGTAHSAAQQPQHYWQNIVSLLVQNFPPYALPLAFGREVAAELLNLPDRVDWRRCVESEAEEAKNAAEIHNLLKPFIPPPSAPA